MKERPDSPYGTRVDAHTIRFERDLPGPIERVWAYLTESNKRATWLYAGKIPREPGGEEHKSWPGEDGEPGFSVTIRTRVFDPPHVLEYEWIERTGDAAPSSSNVRFELRERGDQVRLTLTHAALAPDSFASIAAGWHAHLDVFGDVLRGVQGADANSRYEGVMPHYEALAAST